jgi:2-keto-4-pentenoate hydratase/2-oxohepta-3-ene-1,7-dioic acid hydratase in catechol pathway
LRLVTFEDDSGVRFGVLEEDLVRDVVTEDSDLPAALLDVVRGGEAALERIEAALPESPPLPVSTVSLLAPIPELPGNVIAIGRNYRDHAQEFARSGFDSSGNTDVPSHPVIFTKARSSVTGPGSPVQTSNDPTHTTDYEGEFCVVIGKETRSVPASNVFDHIFGYTIINDVTARELQSRHIQWFVGKSPDTFCPMGPCIVTADEMPDLSAIELRTVVNGETRQAFSLSDMIFDIPTLVATLSEVMTLRPGDLIATGTGLGVGIGFDPPRFLEPGDVVEITVDGIGTLSNPVE